MFSKFKDLTREQLRELVSGNPSIKQHANAFFDNKIDGLILAEIGTREEFKEYMKEIGISGMETIKVFAHLTNSQLDILPNPPIKSSDGIISPSGMIPEAVTQPSIQIRPIDWAHISLHPTDPLKLGEGGFAYVIKGKYFHSNVAIKIIPKAQHFEMARKEALFLSEAENLNGERFVKVLGMCTGPVPDHIRVPLQDMGLPFPMNPPPVGIVLNFEPGNLEQCLFSPTKRRPVHIEDRFKILAALSHGLMILHSAGYVHGDLKPENILLNQHLEPRLTDFGLSRTLSEINDSLMSGSFTGTLQGTPAYLAPELIQRSEGGYLKPSRRTDIYAFSILCWEVLAGRRVINSGVSPIQILTGAVSGDRPPLNVLANTLPTRIDSQKICELLTAGWHQDRTKRSTASEFYNLFNFLHESLVKYSFDVYLSHSAEDRLFLSRLYKSLHLENGLRVWFDQLGQFGGEDQPDIFERSSVILVCLSKHFQNNANCVNSLKLALRLGKPLLLLFVDPDPCPDPRVWLNPEMQRLLGDRLRDTMWFNIGGARAAIRLWKPLTSESDEEFDDRLKTQEEKLSVELNKPGGPMEFIQQILNPSFSVNPPMPPLSLPPISSSSSSVDDFNSSEPPLMVRSYLFDCRMRRMDTQPNLSLNHSSSSPSTTTTSSLPLGPPLTHQPSASSSSSFGSTASRIIPPPPTTSSISSLAPVDGLDFTALLSGLSLPSRGSAPTTTITTNNNNNNNNNNLLAMRVKTPLHQACSMYNGRARLAGLVAEGLDINAQDEKGDTPLMKAVAASHSENIQEILKLGADPNIPNDLGMYPCFFALQRGEFSITQLILDSGRVNLELKDRMGLTLLHLAVVRDDMEILKHLLSLGASLYTPEANGISAVALACGSGNIDSVKEFIAFDPSLESLIAAQRSNATPLHIAASRGSVEIVEAVINAASDRPEVLQRILFAVDHDQDTVLHVVCKLSVQDGTRRENEDMAENKLQLARLLCSKGASMTERNDNGANPFEIAMVSKRLRMCRMMIEEFGFDVNTRVVQKNATVLMIAAIKMLKPMVSLFLESRPDLTPVDNEGDNVLQYATGSAEYSAECVRMLVAAGANPYQPNRRDRTTLHRMVSKSMNEGLLYILDHMAQPVTPAQLDMKDRAGDPALHDALLNRNEVGARYLIERGASVNIRNKLGKTAISFASTESARNLVRDAENIRRQYLESQAQESNPIVKEIRRLRPQFGDLTSTYEAQFQSYFSSAQDVHSLFTELGAEDFTQFRNSFALDWDPAPTEEHRTLILGLLDKFSTTQNNS